MPAWTPPGLRAPAQRARPRRPDRAADALAAHPAPAPDIPRLLALQTLDLLQSPHLPLLRRCHGPAHAQAAHSTAGQRGL